jgi:hypothetical protein
MRLLYSAQAKSSDGLHSITQSWQILTSTAHWAGGLTVTVDPLAGLAGPTREPAADMADMLADGCA